MDDPLLVRGLQRFRHLLRYVQRFLQRNGSGGDSVGKSRALDVFHDEVIRPDIMESANVRMVERSDGSRFALEALAELLGGDLDCNDAIQARVASFVHFTHATFAYGADDLVRTKSG
jgi:hypothetical protein